MLRSFRIRITLLAVALSSVVLVVFGMVAWSLSYRIGLDRADEKLRDELRRANNESRRPEYWERMERAIRSDVVFPQDRIPMAVSARERGTGRIIHQTSTWPGEIDAAKFTDPPEPRAPPPRNQAAPRGPGRRAEPPDDLSSPSESQPRDGAMSGPPRDGEPPTPPPPLSFGQFVTVRTTNGNWRAGAGGSIHATYVAALSLRPLEIGQAQLLRALVTAAVPGLLLIAIAGWILASRALRPVAALTGAAERITARGLNQRMPATREAEEFQRLTDVFNDMLDRLEKSFQQATRFSADAAHELKTPLTILQGQLEESLRAASDGSEQQRLCADLLEEVQRLKNIVRKLLLLSLADAGELKLHREPVDLGALVENAAEDARILAPKLQIETSVAPGVKISADPDLIEQVLQNLVSNAIKYNRDGGFVRIELEQKPKSVRLAVTNSGAVIPARDFNRVFERFYRGDPSRSKTVEGVGLGLSLAREIARAHGSDLVLERSDESGTTFALLLPLS